MQKQKVKTYISKYEHFETKQGRGVNAGKKVKVRKDYYIVRYKYIDNEGEKKESSKRFKEKKDAEEFAESLKGNFVVPNKMIMNQLFDLWFEDYQSDDDLAENTIKWHYYNLLHLRKRLGNKLVQDVNRPMINSFLSDLKKTEPEKALSTTSVNNIRRTLRQALDFAVEAQYISVNPLKANKRKRNTKKTIVQQQTQFKAVVISQTKIIELIESVTDPVIALVIALAGLLGLRRGEIRGLLWEDVNLDKKLLYVRKQLCNNKKERDILKSVSSERTLRIPDYVVSLLQQICELQRDAKLIFGEDKFASSYVLAHTSMKIYIGKPYSANYYSDGFSQILKERKMKKMRLHDLRHSFGSNLIYQGIPIPTVSKMMGHHSIVVTLKTYAHEIEELKAKDEEKINLNIEETLSSVRNSSLESKDYQISPRIIQFKDFVVK